MFGAISRSSTGHNLATLSDKTAQNSHVLIIDRKRFVRTETTNLAASAGPPTTAGSTFAIPAALAARLI
jgi:hypothetical protein